MFKCKDIIKQMKKKTDFFLNKAKEEPLVHANFIDHYGGIHLYVAPLCGIRLDKCSFFVRMIPIILILIYMDNMMLLNIFDKKTMALNLWPFY